MRTACTESLTPYLINGAFVGAAIGWVFVRPVAGAADIAIIVAAAGVPPLLFGVAGHFLGRSVEARNAEAAREFEFLSSIPVETARDLFMSNTDRYRLSRADPNGSVPHAERLGPALTELFSHYSSVDCIIGVDLIAPFSSEPELLSIGSDDEFSFVVRPNDDRIYTVFSPEDADDEDAYPSIWHFLIAEAGIVNLAGVPGDTDE